MATKKADKPPHGLPTSVRLLSQTWGIVYVDHVEKGEHLLGACEASSRTIYIDKDQSRESMLDTLIHELCHAAIAMSPFSGAFSDEEEEKLVLFMTTSFISLARDNPDMIELLYE